jgi:hypothetical protein
VIVPLKFLLSSIPGTIKCVEDINLCIYGSNYVLVLLLIVFTGPVFARQPEVSGQWLL